MDTIVDGPLHMAIQASELAPAYSENNPFPHLVLHNSWDEALLSEVAAECDAFTDWDEEKAFYGSIGKRACGTFSKLPPCTAKLISYCNSSKFLAFLEGLTGEEGLIPIHICLVEVFIQRSIRDFSRCMRISIGTIA